MVGTIVPLCKWLTCSVGGPQPLPTPGRQLHLFLITNPESRIRLAGGSSYFLTPTPPLSRPYLFPPPLLSRDSAVRVLVSAAPLLARR